METPRPPKRSVTGGRFPIKPSVSGIEITPDLKSSSPDNHAPPIPQRSHARNASTHSSSITRAGLAPLPDGGKDIGRSRSETLSSSASVRQRRLGYVPSRKPTVELRAVDETSDQASSRSSQASTIRPTHSRATSSVSTANGLLNTSSGEASSGAMSPVEGRASRHSSVRRLSSLPENRNSKVQPQSAVKASKRLLLTLFELHRPIREVAIAIKDSTPKKTTLERQLFSANAHVNEMDRLLNRLDNGMETDRNRAIKTIIEASSHALKSYGAVTTELKRNNSKLVRIADGIYVRGLMFQIYNAMVEAKNICVILGFKVEHNTGMQGPARVSQAWSSRTVTPTQPKTTITSRRLRGANILQNMGRDNSLRSMPAPPAPISTNSSRTNTMNSSFTTATPSSAGSFSTIASGHPNISRSNTMRSATDDGDSDEQFDRIFLKLKPACELAGNALMHCRLECSTRQASAQTAGMTQAAHAWQLALNKCETAINDTRALRKRLEVVSVNDPVVRFSKEFWSLCDNFVHVSLHASSHTNCNTAKRKPPQSWTGLATEIKDIGSQRIDITTMKSIMRNVQRAVKEVSKTISHSPLYHQTGSRGPDSAGPTSLAPPFPSGLTTAFQSHAATSSTPSGFVTPVPATPLGAALGPAVQATVASTPNGTQASRDFAEPHTVRAVHERNDTVIQSGRMRRQ